jgi:hypothetical protein
MGGGQSLAAWIALGLAMLLCILLIWSWKKMAATASGIVSIGVLTTLLVSPYLLNYDFLLLVVPLITLAREARLSLEWIALALAYILPPAALALWGPAGNPALIASMGSVLVLTLRRISRVNSEAVRPSA